MSECGKAAFIAATDPFHDNPIEHIRGWPDLETQPSVIRLIKRSVTIKAPDAGSNIELFTYPVIDSSVTNRSTRRNCVIDQVNQSVSDLASCAPVVIHSYNAANASNMMLNNWTEEQTLGIEQDYLTSPTRIIGMGVEVRDVTAPLYRQGVCTVYQVPQTQDEDSTFNFKAMTLTSGLTKIATVQDGRIFTPNCQTIRQALAFEGSRQWKAEEGAYLVIPFSSKDNIATPPEYTMPCIRALAQDMDSIGTLNTTTLYTGNFASGGAAGDNFVFMPHMFTPMHSKGVILSGLSEHSTFQINANFFLETFPRTSDDPLVTLARPSCEYDPVALELISKTMKTIPVAVPVSENGLGDFFLDVVEKVAPTIGNLASVAFPEFSPFIKTGTTLATDWAGAAKKSRAKQKAKNKRKRQRQVKEIVDTERAIAKGAAARAANRETNRQLTAPNSFGKPASERAARRRENRLKRKAEKEEMLRAWLES